MKKDELKFEDLLIIKGIYVRGFGNIPKIVMQDQRLTIQAKAIYAYFSSYCGGGSTSAFPSIEKILYDLNISRNTYFKHIKPLRECGYIQVSQVKKDGKFANNIYELMMNPKPQTEPNIVTEDEYLKLKDEIEEEKRASETPPPVEWYDENWMDN